MTWVIPTITLLGMGASMPSCPGQQAMQAQVESLHNSDVEMNKKVQALTQQVTTLTNDMNQVKTLLPQMTNVIQAQKGALDQLSNSVKEMQAHAAPAPKALAPAKKRR